jgi:hypothetical protein
VKISKESTIHVTLETVAVYLALLRNAAMMLHYYGNITPALHHTI